MNSARTPARTIMVAAAESFDSYQWFGGAPQKYNCDHGVSANLLPTALFSQ
jgi:hypothetical protein